MDEILVDTHLPFIGNKWEQVGKCFLIRNSARQETSRASWIQIIYIFSLCPDASRLHRSEFFKRSRGPTLDHHPDEKMMKSPVSTAGSTLLHQLVSFLNNVPNALVFPPSAQICGEGTPTYHSRYLHLTELNLLADFRGYFTLKKWSHFGINPSFLWNHSCAADLVWQNHSPSSSKWC